MNSNFYKDKIILVTGGTGTIGAEIVSQLLKFDPKLIIVLSNSENELWENKVKYSETVDEALLLNSINKLKFILCDIRNLRSLQKATENVDYIFNAAAIKHVAISEYDPIEAIDVNIHGLENIIEVAKNQKVKNIVHISTDKAVNPTTVMGATKMLGERICIANSNQYQNGMKISCVRFGNVLGSRGSVIPLIKDRMDKGQDILLTHSEMKRFFMSISEAVELVIKAMPYSQGGEIFVLKMPTVRILDLLEIVRDEYAKVLNKDPNSFSIKTIGPGPGEKLDEELISPIEYSSCYSIDERMYVIYPRNWDYLTLHNKKWNKISENSFVYSTKDQEVLKKPEIRKLLIEKNLI